LEPLLSFFTTDCQPVEERQMYDDSESKEDLCASDRQTDSKNGLFLELITEQPQGRVREVPEGGLASLELQFRRDELLSYPEYRKTELTRKSADWINRASNAFWLSTFGIISAKTSPTYAKETLARYDSEDSKSKVLTFAVAFLKHLAKIHLDYAIVHLSCSLRDLGVTPQVSQ
jgi:hypothetical protein